MLFSHEIRSVCLSFLTDPNDHYDSLMMQINTYLSSWVFITFTTNLDSITSVRKQKDMTPFCPILGSKPISPWHLSAISNVRCFVMCKHLAEFDIHLILMGFSVGVMPVGRYRANAWLFTKKHLSLEDRVNWHHLLLKETLCISFSRSDTI